MNALKTIALILVIIGGLNWGLIGLINFDLIAVVLGEMSNSSRVAYILVGLAAAYMAFTSFTETKPKPEIETKTDFE